MAKKKSKGGNGDVVEDLPVPGTADFGGVAQSATGAAAPLSAGSNGKTKQKRKRKTTGQDETVEEGLDELDESGIEAAQVAAALSQPSRDVIDPALQAEPTATAVQYQPPKKKQKRQPIAIEPSLAAPEAGPSMSDSEAALRLQEVLNFTMQGGDQADGDATAAANALASAASIPNFSSATQEQLLAALRNINPDLVIHDPRAASTSPPRQRTAASTNSAPATTARDLPQFTGEKDLPVSQGLPGSDAVIDPALVSGAGGKSALNPTLMTSLAGMTHRDVLAQKWLNTTQLNELSDSQGLDFKKGQFSLTEKNIVEQAISEYRHKFSLDLDDVRAIIYAKGKKSRSQHPDFFPSIAASLEARPLIAVYNYVRRAYDPLGKKGNWTPEEDQKLADAVAEHGMNWGAVSALVDRTKSDCRDRWRNHVSVRETKNTGKWSPEEEAALREAVKSVTTDQGRSADQDVFWSAVSKALGGSRSRAQCRIKWLDSMNPKEKNEGDAVSWTHRDSLILVQRLLGHGMTDDTGFDWKQLGDDTWGRLFSTHIMQVRWRRLKKRYSKDSEHLSLPQLLEKIIGELETKTDEQLNMPTRASTKPAGPGFDTPAPMGEGTSM